MSGSRKCNIKDLLPFQEGESCQGRLLSAGKMEGKGVRAQREEEVQGSCLGQHREPRVTNRNIPKLSCLFLHGVPALLGNQQGEIQQVQREISLLSVAEAEQWR